ncbi:MAG: T9SS type A sorting domain-containing protein [Bacteroidota bacterium]
MKNFSLLFLFVVVSILQLFSATPKKSLAEILEQNERNPQLGIAAKQLARTQHIPFNMYLEEGILMDALDVENGNVVYAVMTNLLRPFDGGATMFYEDIVQQYDMQNATINFFRPIVTDKNFKKKNTSDYVRKGAGGVVVVPNWTDDNVLAFDPNTGDLIDDMFIPSDSINLASPKHALLTPRGTITVSDQIKDLVQDYDTAGTYLLPFAPAGGVNNSILDNIRGHAYKPTDGHCLVTVANGANQNNIAEFDLDGNHIGNFITGSASGLISPFCIIFRNEDVLACGGSGASSKVLRYDFNGAFLDTFTTLTSFPQQITELRNGNVAVAYFSTPSGLRIFSPTGELLQYFSAVTGLRGAYELPSGHFLVTNASGLHELDEGGSLIRTIVTATNLQYLSYINFSSVGVRELRGIVPDKFSLEQNYPNPFNPVTAIGFSLLAVGDVTLKIYDVLGREVATLINNEKKDAGKYSVQFDATNLPSGIYIYKLTAGSFTDMKKMVLMK